MNDLHRLLEPVEGYMMLQMYQDAWNELESMPPEFRANAAVLEFRIVIYQALGKWESARMLAESLAKQVPENPQWWILWAYSLRREKSVADACAVLMDAAVHHPGEALIHYNLACYSCVEGHIDAAKALLGKAFALDQNLRIIAMDDPDLKPIWR